jgi:predicted regulator of Ras-like GTPase activity (Roadblock/LC7/MglB family)
MAFLDILKQIVDNFEGCIGGILIGLDGIVVEQYTKEDEVIDFQNIGVEYMNLIKTIAETSHTLGFDEPEQLIIEYKDTVLIIRAINKDYFVILASRKEGNIGKGKFLLRKNIFNFSREF